MTKTNTVERYVTTLGALTVLTVLASLLFLAGCNTVKGIAKDVYTTTEALQSSFSDTNKPEAAVRPHDWD